MSNLSQPNGNLQADFLELPVMRRWFFFYENEEDGWTFEVEAKDHEQALQVAYDNHGPQVCSMHYREVSNGS